MKNLHLLLLLVVFIKCSDPTNDISSKEEFIIRNGCLISHSTKGEQEFEKLLSNSHNNEKLMLCFSILRDNHLYHLHDKAGFELDKLIERQTDSTLCLLLKTNRYRDSLHIDIKENIRNEIFKKIDDPVCSDHYKKYFMEALYSLSSTEKSGKLINEYIANSNINDSLKFYNEQLFTSYIKYKPVFEKLNSIKTWMEMDKQFDLIEKALTDYHPLVFNQILFFNPSTVLNSDKLSALKKKSIEDMMNEVDETSFYRINRLTYLKELLCYNYYSIRFLERIIPESEFNDYVKKIEDELNTFTPPLSSYTKRDNQI